MRRLTIPLALSLTLLVSATALADGSRQSSDVDPQLRAPGGLLDDGMKHRSPQLTLFVGLPSWYWGFGPVGIGGRFYAPLLHQGLLPGVNDSFGIEVGADLSFYGFNTFASFLDIPVEAMWTLHLVPSVAAYLKFGVALELRFGSGYWGGYRWSNGDVGPVLVGAAGVSVQLTPRITLRLEFGYPWFKLGLGFPF